LLNNTSKNRILGIITLYKRKRLNPNTLKIVAYVEVGKLAIITL